MTSYQRDLMARVKAESSALFTGRYAEDHEAILHRAVALIGIDGTLDGVTANALFKHTRHSMKREKQRRAFKLVTAVLEAINATGLATCAMPRRRYQPMRDQTRARSEARAGQQATAYAMDQYVDDWVRRRGPLMPAARLLALAMRLVTRGGFGAELVSGSLARLTSTRVDKNGTLLLPVDVADFSAATYRWPLPKSCRRLLPRPTAGASQNTALLFADVLGEPIDAALPEDERIHAAYRKRDEVARCLQKAFEQFARDFERERGTPKHARLRHWRTFCEVGRLIPQGRGLMPVLVTLGERFPLPACTDLFALHERETGRGERTRHIDQQTPPPEPPTASTPDQRFTAPAGYPCFDTEALPRNWAVKARGILERFIRDVESLAGPNDYVTQRSRPQLKAQYKRRHKESTALWRPRSMADAGLGWLYELAAKGAKVATLKTYLSRLFSIEALILDPAIDIRVWDDDTVKEMTDAITASKAWQRSTVGHFKQTFGDFLRYTIRMGWVSDVEWLPSGQIGVHSAKRVDILSAQEINAIWRCCCDEGGDWAEQAAVAVVLGFYGGLRASEVIGLTLKDVYIDHGELHVDIPHGKTGAARRTLRLDHLAPPKMTAWLTEFVKDRQAQFAGRAFKDWRINEIALLGPRGNPDCYTRAGLIDPLIGWMRRHLGDDVDFHLLRHCFASWLMLRVYAMRHPEFAKTLPQKNATMFQPESLERLRVLFDGKVHQGAGTDDAIHFKKLMGHERLQTALRYYIHTFDWIHADVMRRAFNEGPRVKVG